MNSAAGIAWGSHMSDPAQVAAEVCELKRAFQDAVEAGGVAAETRDGRLLLHAGLVAKGAISGWCVPVRPEDAERRANAVALAAVTRFASHAMVYAELSAELSPHYRPVTDPASGAEFLPDRDAANAKVQEYLAEARGEVLVGQPGTRTETELTAVVDRDVAVVRRGVRVQTLYSETARTSSAIRAHVRTMSEAGAQFRVAHRPIPKVVVIDRRVALVSDECHRASAPRAYLVTDPAMVAFVAHDFDRDWEQAEDWCRDSAPAASAGLLGGDERKRNQKRAVLAQLAAGHAQLVAARRLGMAKSTLTKLIKEMLEERGFESTFQLAVWAGQHPEVLRT